MGDSDETLDDLQAYERRAIGILKERELRVREMEDRLTYLDRELKKYTVHQLARAGKVLEIQRGEGMRSNMIEQRKKLIAGLVEARTEVNSARERLAMIVSDIKALIGQGVQ